MASDVQKYKVVSNGLRFRCGANEADTIDKVASSLSEKGVKNIFKKTMAFHHLGG